VCFTDLEGRLHMLDYDKKFLLRSADNLTFDGSSVRGFSQQHESDLRLVIDWPAFYWLPSDVFGPGKVLVFAEVRGQDGSPYHADLRARLKQLRRRSCTRRTARSPSSRTRSRASCSRAATRSGATRDRALRVHLDRRVLSFAARRPLRRFIDSAAEVQRAMGFGNEKDHPEVAPSQFEMNFSYTEASSRPTRSSCTSCCAARSRRTTT
jgi:glutamine synthetase